MDLTTLIEPIQAYGGYAVIVLALCCLGLLLYAVSISGRVGRLARSREAKLADGTVGDIVAAISEQSTRLSAIEQRLSAIESAQDQLGKRLVSCVQQVGMVRFDAFEDVGGEQSFAIALLDGQRNGVIVSNIYGRQDSRLYVKAIAGGAAERALSTEEQNAMKIAEANS